MNFLLTFVSKYDRLKVERQTLSPRFTRIRGKPKESEMETNQFAEFASAVVRQLPRNLDGVTVQRWIRKQAALADVLRKALVPAFEPYLAPGQQNGAWMKGFDLDKHLEETKLIDRTMSLDDELVKGWLADPSTYPEEFKNKAVFLWKSKRSSGDGAFVAFLFWRVGRVILIWRWLGGRWLGASPVLLASS